jgi:hypothetical protein
MNNRMSREVWDRIILSCHVRIAVVVRENGYKPGTPEYECLAKVCKKMHIPNQRHKLRNALYFFRELIGEGSTLSQDFQDTLWNILEQFDRDITQYDRSR